MPILRRISAFLKLLFHRRALEAELDAELQSFYQTMVERYVEQGLTEAEAPVSPPELQSSRAG